ncbi:hypothetical protein K3495_g5739 [Podosphaera aphanis]|nr:hypothetical protein K3495_g5739 [Podosphaera aphanis]
MLEERSPKLGYFCREPGKKSKQKFIKLKNINESATKACERLGATKFTTWHFPAPYPAAVYSAPGPYVEWPIGYKGPLSKKRPSIHHVVINAQCDIVDVVTHHTDGHYEQCERKWK